MEGADGDDDRDDGGTVLLLHPLKDLLLPVVVHQHVGVTGLLGKEYLALVV